MKILSYNAGIRHFKSLESAIAHANILTTPNSYYYVEKITIGAYADFGEFEGGFQLGHSIGGEFVTDEQGPYSELS